MSALLANALSQEDVSKRDGERNIVTPPVSAKRFEPRAGEGPAKWPSYAQHPAYRDEITSALPAARLKALMTFAKHFSVILGKRLISYELIPAHIRSRGGIAFVRAALANMAGKLASTRINVGDHGRGVADALTHDGICVAKIEPDQLASIDAAARPPLDALRKARGQRASGGRDFMESRTSALRGENDQLFSAVENMLARTGILAGVSRYLGRPAKLVDVNPQINDPSDDFWEKIFVDQPPAPRPTAYFHKDASGGDIKAIIYLTDVNAESGPFCYAIGSHRCRQSTLAGWIEEANDRSGLSATHLAARRQFSALPSALRRKGAFGNDLPADAEISRRVLGAEWVITESRGHIAIFDTKGFHRGGMVVKGERVVLTCVLGSARRAQPTFSGRNSTSQLK